MILDILLVAVLVILFPLILLAIVFSLALVVGVIKAMLPSTRRKEKEEFEKRAREALREFEVLEGGSSRK